MRRYMLDTNAASGQAFGQVAGLLVEDWTD